MCVCWLTFGFWSKSLILFRTWKTVCVFKIVWIQKNTWPFTLFSQQYFCVCVCGWLCACVWLAVCAVCYCGVVLREVPCGTDKEHFDGSGHFSCQKPCGKWVPDCPAAHWAPGLLYVKHLVTNRLPWPLHSPSLCIKLCSCLHDVCTLHSIFHFTICKRRENMHIILTVC